jgi:short-subunit dehydrogenase
VCDFSVVCSIAEYREIVAKNVAHLDIAMVFLNAGTLIPGNYVGQSDKQVETVYRMNTLHGIYMTKALLPQQLNRSKRSALIITSSFLS